MKQPATSAALPLSRYCLATLLISDISSGVNSHPQFWRAFPGEPGLDDYKYKNTNKIYIVPGILKRIGAQTHGVTRW